MLLLLSHFIAELLLFTMKATLLQNIYAVPFIGK